MDFAVFDHRGKRFWGHFAGSDRCGTAQQPIFTRFDPWKDSCCLGYAMGMQQGWVEVDLSF
jgi:hypothetical protein